VLPISGGPANRSASQAPDRASRHEIDEDGDGSLDGDDTNAADIVCLP